MIALMMEAATTSETSVNYYCTTRRYKPEDSHLYLNNLCFSPFIVTLYNGTMEKVEQWGAS
jgi:hypothetical protein